MSKNNSLSSPKCGSDTDLDYLSFFHVLSLFLCILAHRFTPNEYVQATYKSFFNHIHSIPELLENLQTPFRLALQTFASQIDATVSVIPRTAFQKGTSSLAEAYSKTVSHLLPHVTLIVEQNSAMAYNKVISVFTLCTNVLQTYSIATTSYLNGLVGKTSVFQLYLAIVASYFSGSCTKASLLISNAWSSLKIRQIVITPPFRIGKVKYLTVLVSQAWSKDTSLREVILAMIRPLINSLATLRQKAAHNFSQLDMIDLISFYIVATYLAFVIALTLLGRGESNRSMLYFLRKKMCIPGICRGSDCLSVMGHNTELFHEFRCALFLIDFSRACKWLSTTGAHLSSSIRRAGRYTMAWLQALSPIRLRSYVGRVGQYTKAWLKSSFNTPDTKLLLFSTMALVLNLIVEPLRRRTMGGYQARPWPPTSAIQSLVCHIALLLIGLVQGIKVRLWRCSDMLHTLLRYLSPIYPGGLRHGLRLTISSAVADIIDVLITLVCLAVFLAIALCYQVILFTMAVRLLEKMFSVSVFNKVDHWQPCV